jgi:hypothetical protein
MSHTGNRLGLNNPMILGQSLGMNPHVMNLINLLKTGETSLGFRITIGRIMEEMAMMARKEMSIMLIPIMPLREIGISSREG